MNWIHKEIRQVIAHEEKDHFSNNARKNNWEFGNTYF